MSKPTVFKANVVILVGATATVKEYTDGEIEVMEVDEVLEVLEIEDVQAK